jgi:hypothetical protein
MLIKYVDNEFIRKREKQAEEIFAQLPYRYCFITGSFIYQEKYRDIDVFVITRSKKKIELKDKMVKVQTLDFNDLYSLFYHSVSKSCIAKNILPQKPLKVTLSDYWNTINETVPTIFNEKHRFRKYIRDVILYTAYFKTGQVLSSPELNEKINSFKSFSEVLDYINREVPEIVRKSASKSYIKRFFYTESGGYSDMLKYDSHRFLYELCHSAISGLHNG